MLLCFAAGIILGIFVRSDGFIEIVNFLSRDYFLIVFGQKPMSTIIISRCVNNFGMIIIMSLCFLTPYLIPLNYLFLAYRGFILGSVICSLVASFGVAGVLLVIFLIVPIQFISNFIFIIAGVNGVITIKKRQGTSMWLFVLTVFLIYLLSIISALLETTIVIIIIRPLNFVL
ncbi:MAG: hypothetical protein RR327_07305 [Clostridia bacterium]